MKHTVTVSAILVSLSFTFALFCHQVAGGRIEIQSNNLGGAYHRFHAYKKDTDDVSRISFRDGPLMIWGGGPRAENLC